MHALLCGSKTLLTIFQIINKPDVSSSADEIAEPHPEMNIKVAAFTVSEKSSNICHQNSLKGMSSYSFKEDNSNGQQGRATIYARSTPS